MHRMLLFALAAVAAIVIAHLLDGWAWLHLVEPEVYERDLGRMLRVIGYLPLWFVVAIATWRLTGNRRNAMAIVIVPAIGGLLAELLKIVLRRERPNLHDGEYVFRAFSDQPWATKAIGLPSSHVLVAFAGVWLMCRLFPRATVVWVALGVGCAVTRVQAHAHFLSDVAVAAVAAFVLVDFLWQRAGLTVHH